MYNAGNNCRRKEKKEALYAMDGRHQKCNWTLSKRLNQLVKDRKKWNSLVNYIVKNKKRINGNLVFQNNPLAGNVLSL